MWGYAISINLRINDRIRVREVRLINAAGEQVGIVLTVKALEASAEMGLDLVEVSPEAKPPVCKIMDYGKFKYMSEKKEKEARKKTHTIVTKEMKIRPKIGEHDLAIKLKHTREFLEEGNRVRMVITFRGREMAHQELGRSVLEKALKELESIALVDQGARFEGSNLGVTLAPKPGVVKPKVKVAPAPAKGEKKEKAEKTEKPNKTEKIEKKASKPE